MTDAELAELVERDYLDYAAAYDGLPGVEVIREPDLLARRSVAAHGYLNLVLGAWFGDGDAGRRIGEVTARLGGPGRPFTWTVWPSARPLDLGERLEAHGFRPDGEGPLMVLELGTAPTPPAPPADLLVERVTTPEALAEVSDAIADGMGDGSGAARTFAEAYARLALEPRARMTCFAGRFDGRVVATSALYTGTGQAGIYGVQTVEEVRGRGFGTALTAAALEDGRRRGLARAVLLSSELGAPIYRRLGFRLVGQAAFYGWPGRATMEPSPSDGPA